MNDRRARLIASASAGLFSGLGRIEEWTALEFVARIPDLFLEIGFFVFAFFSVELVLKNAIEHYRPRPRPR